MNKIRWWFVLLLVAIIGIVAATTNAEEKLIFGQHKQTVSGLELQLALFDLKVNYLNILSKISYLDSISSMGFESKILSSVVVLPSIMHGTLRQKKGRIKKLCEDLFKEYQRKFAMVNARTFDELMREEVNDIDLVDMKPCNLSISVSIHVRKYRSLARWYCGHIEYKDGFFE